MKNYQMIPKEKSIAINKILEKSPKDLSNYKCFVLNL